MVQSSMTPTKTIFKLAAGLVEFNVTFLTPIKPEDFVQQSIPFSYLYVDGFTSTDSQPHSIQIYCDILAEWAAADLDAVVTWNTSSEQRMIYHRINRGSPEVDRNWNCSNLTYQAGNADSTMRAQFIDSGVLDNSLNQSSKTVKDPNSDMDWLVFSFAVDLGTLSSTSRPDPVLWAIGIVEDSLVTYPLPPSSRVAYYWTKYLNDASVISNFLENFPSALNRSLEFDSEIMTAANKISSNYTEILSLVTRQIFASMEITVARNNDNSLDTSKTRIFMKDMGSTK
ncbi:hypothetical protein NP233_g11179 [Leucocoprinus birnbaumii]|uniref:Glutaminase A N-terminal domain-containing protein n=1 Tax=Leucocoprinus birnbaumii TaxID=56174 RepID=A0AAD5VJ18_9AGAR|nr:hypothetical protein NP233_g11179 [Leucocoprinus birnbaumii]